MPDITYDEVLKKSEAIQLALGMPPYTEAALVELFTRHDAVSLNAREAVAWLASDFVQNWLKELAARRQSYG